MKRINYKLNEKNIIVSYVEIPFDENKPFLELADDEKIFIGYSKVVDGLFYKNEEKYQLLKNAKLELKEIKEWFLDNDWKINKVAVGEWANNDERYVSYLAERQEKRKRQDELNEVINNG